MGWGFRTVVLEKTLESPLDSKAIKPVNPKENQPWIFIEGPDAEALILWPLDAKIWLIGRDPDAGKNWGQEVKGATGDERVGWHHWLNGHELEQIQLWEIVKDREAWRAAVHGVTKSRTRLSDFHFHFHILHAVLIKYRCCCCSVAQSYLTLFHPMDCSTPGFPGLHYLLEFAQTYVHWVSDAIQLSHFLLLPSLSAFNLSQYQDLFQWISYSHQVSKVLEFQLQHRSFQWYSGLIFFRIDWFDLLAVQGTLKSLLQHHNSKASILQCSPFFLVQLSHPYVTTGKPMALTIGRWSDVSAFQYAV